MEMETCRYTATNFDCAQCRAPAEWFLATPAPGANLCDACFQSAQRDEAEAEEHTATPTADKLQAWRDHRDEPWGCSACGAGASHQSVSYPSLCTDCAVAAVRRLF